MHEIRTIVIGISFITYTIKTICAIYTLIYNIHIYIYSACTVCIVNISKREREKTTFPPFHPALKVIPTFLCLDNSTMLLLFQEASPSTSLLCPCAPGIPTQLG